MPAQYIEAAAPAARFEREIDKIASTRIGAAYDSLAAEYDGHLARDAWTRRILWRHFDRLFREGDRVLDVGCGTGSDTVHLASRRVRVTAVDVSPGMIAQLRAKLGDAALASMVDVRLGDINDLAPALTGPFDGVVSSFAALNTVDLTRFAAAAARLVRPGGRIVCHMLAPGYAAGRPDGGAGSAVIDVAGQPLPHLQLPAGQVYRRFFAADFAQRASYALGFLVSRKMEMILPAPALDLLGHIEAIVGAAPPLVSAGRFFVLDLERRPRAAVE